MFTRDKDRRAKIFEFVRSYIEEHGFAPSIREIGQAVGIRSTKAVKYHLDILVNEGLLQRTDRQARTLRTSYQPDALPLMGRIAAGTPLLAVENVEARISLNQFRDCFLLKVKGDSMKGAGILDGDMVIVRPQSSAGNGEIIAALLDNEATVKRLHQTRHSIILEPANPDFEPIVVDTTRCDFRIIGIVAGLLRNYNK
ncbi:transcriptional repressor LexA [candidate division WOR-3 bacterium]|nr:transcriptional repressor LexA [candidate division WOR-3 bacterium]